MIPRVTSGHTDTSERNDTPNSVGDHREYMAANGYHPGDYSDSRRDH